MTSRKLSKLLKAKSKKKKNSQHLISRFKKKNIIIVGNAPTNLDNEFGKLIDSFDTIIRFNEFQIKDYEKNIGTKTLIWVISDFVAINLLQKYKNWLDDNNKVKILIVIPYKTNDPNKFYEEGYKEMNDFYNQSDIKNELFFINKDFVKKIQTDYEFYPHWPSTGLLTILYFIQFNKSISFTGFNFFQKIGGGDKIHYYNDNCISNHNGDKEKIIVNKLIETKKVKKLIINIS